MYKPFSFRFIYTVLLSMSIVSLALWFMGTTAYAASFAAPFEVEGYAWSSNIGWVSMNCSNTGTCGTSDYKVTVQTDGQLTGYAWSANIGWIKFDGLSGFQTGAGTTPQSSRLVDVGTGYQLEGWVRACAGTVGGNCSTMTSRTDGWDGWIALRGSTVPPAGSYGITMNSNLVVANDSFAWGGPVVGWMAWHPIGGFGGVRFNHPPTINSFSVVPSEIRQEDPVTITWDTAYADECIASNDRSDANWQDAPLLPVAGSRTFQPQRGTTNFTITCRKAGHADVTQTESVVALPDIRIDNFSQVPSVPPMAPASGLYPTVPFSAVVTGLSVGDTVPYRLIMGALTQTGNYTVTATTNAFTPPLTLSNVPFGTYDPIRLELDLPDPGSIAEDRVSTPAVDEDIDGNSRSLSAPLVLAAPPVQVNQFAATQPFVRFDTTATIEWDLSAPYVATCTITGPGVSRTITLTGAPGTPDQDDGFVVTSSGLTSTSIYTLQCTAADPTIDAGPDQAINIQVTPRIEEI